MIGNALVIGAGIGGLAVALALAQRGVAVTVLEQSPEIREVGAGIQISPNGLAVLRALGLEGALDRSGAVQARGVILQDYRAGATVARLDLTRRPDRRYLFVHRADLISVLAAAARRAGVTLSLGRRMCRVVPGDFPEVVFEDGETLRAELVVCADGLHSVGRSLIEGEAAPGFTGQVAWRALVPARAAEPVVTVTMGPGRHLVSYPLRGGDLMNIVAVQERETWAEEGWHHADDPENLRRAFADFGGPVRALLDDVRDVNLWGLFRHPVAREWVRGNVALLGDAAHPTLPFLAQGANMALEDAWVLAQGLARGDGLQGYTQARRARTERIVETAAGNARKYHLRHGPVRWVAHRGLSIASHLVPGLMLGQFDWLYGFDVTKTETGG